MSPDEMVRVYDQLQELGYWSRRAYGPQVAGWDS